MRTLTRHWARRGSRYKELTQLSRKERTASGSQKVPMPQHRTLCNAGNCETLESKGVNVDSAGLDFRGVSGRVPWPEDLGAAIERNTRKGKYAQYDHGDYSAPSPWGGAISNDPMKVRPNPKPETARRRARPAKRPRCA